MIDKLGEFIKKKIDRKITISKKNKTQIIKEFGITPQYLYDMENGKRVPSASLIKTMIEKLGLSEQEQIELYDLASKSYKEQKVPIDIAEFIINNEKIKNDIRKAIKNEKK